MEILVPLTPAHDVALTALMDLLGLPAPAVLTLALERLHHDEVDAPAHARARATQAAPGGSPAPPPAP